MPESFLGQIALFPYSFTPDGWTDCDGQLMAIQRNTALFSLLGTTYGGDGRVTFGLPNLSGRAAVGMGAFPGGSTYTLGEQTGVESITLVPDMTPPHSHALNAVSALGEVNEAAGALLAQAAKGTLQGYDKGNIYNPGSPDGQLQGSSVVPAGSQQPHNNMQPSLALRYCICVNGAFPQRS